LTDEAVSAGRQRFMEAMLDLVSEHGYEDVSLDQVIARAGGGREDFHAVFSSKEECAIAVLDEVAGSALRAVREGFESKPRWPDSLRASAYALARWITENPKKVRFGMVEALWAGELMQAKRETAFREFIEMVECGREASEDPDRIPAFAAEATIGSITEMFTKRLQRGPVDDPYEFIPELMYLAVLPYLGEEAAKRELTIRPPQQGAN
jgi:AcrR family transcriptional regulator